MDTKRVGAVIEFATRAASASWGGPAPAPELVSELGLWKTCNMTPGFRSIGGAALGRADDSYYIHPEREIESLSKFRAIGAAGSASLIAIALVLTPGLAAAGPRDGAPSIAPRGFGTVTPAVSDPRLAAMLQRRGSAPATEVRLTPASPATERNRAVRVAIRARADTPADAARATAAEGGSAGTVTPLTPISYNLGASVGWRRFALTGDVAREEGGTLPGARESAQVGMSYRATRKITARAEVAAERAEGAQRIVGDDQAYSLDVGGSYSIARNLDVTGGVRYRISRDRLEPLARDERRDSQAVYIGTAFRF